MVDLLGWIPLLNRRQVGSGIPERMVVLCLDPSLHSWYSASMRMSFCFAISSTIFMIFFWLSSRLNLSSRVGMVAVRMPIGISPMCAYRKASTMLISLGATWLPGRTKASSDMDFPIFTKAFTKDG
ncbi:hypothetical protein D3C76_1193950 [compost metagenome]